MLPSDHGGTIHLGYEGRPMAAADNLRRLAFEQPPRVKSALISVGKLWRDHPIKPALENGRFTCPPNGEDKDRMIGSGDHALITLRR